MTDAEVLALKVKILEAETQYHSLMTGTMARVFVDQNGERVEFVAANRGELYRYIAYLKSLLPGTEQVRNYSKPIGFLF